MVLLRQESQRGFVGKRRLTLFLFLLMFGILALLIGLRNSRLEALHGSDILQLVASGICFGLAFGLLLGGRRFLGE